MLKLILLSSLLFLSQQTNAANCSSEDSSYSESTDSESSSSYTDSTDSESSYSDSESINSELSAQDLQEKLRLLDAISVKLWEIYAAQKQKLGVSDSEAKIKTAWLLTMRSVVSRTVYWAMEQTDGCYLFTGTKEFSKIIWYLTRSLRKEKMEIMKPLDFDIDNDDSCFIAIKKADKMAHDLYEPAKNLFGEDEKVKPSAALIKAYIFLLSNIDKIVEPIFSEIYKNLPVQIQFHPFKNDATLIQFYERYFSGLEIREFHYIAPYLVPVVPVAILNENHRLFSARLLDLSLWPIVKEWKMAQGDENSKLWKVLPAELFSSISIKLIEN